MENQSQNYNGKAESANQYWVRYVDELHRILIPRSLLEELNWVGYVPKYENDGTVVLEGVDKSKKNICWCPGENSLPLFFLEHQRKSVKKTKAYKIFISNSNIILHPYKLTCCICGANNEGENIDQIPPEDVKLYKFNENLYCDKCISMLNERRKDAVLSDGVYLMSTRHCYFGKGSK